MQIINAFWEKRNLGVSCDEVLIDADDDLMLIDSTLLSLKSSYRVIKVPAGRPDLLLALQRRGYTFIEMLSTCSHDGVLPKLTKLQERFFSNLSCSLATTEDLNLIFSELSGGMFTTDRVAIDPRFGVDQAAKRYCGWMQDELARGSFFYVLYFKNAPIGFFVMRLTEGNKCHALLGGIFPAYKNGGFGFFLNYFEILIGLDLGAKKIYTTFSSNNSAISSIHYALGCSLVKQQYILISHK